MTGLDLKLKRIASGVKAQDVAAAMGVSAGRLSKIEQQDRLTPQLEQRYMSALAMCQLKAA